jgi:hypothetical protein
MPRPQAAAPLAVRWSNQDVINAFYSVARAMGEDGWTLLRRAGLTWLVRDRSAPYEGPPIEKLPGLSQQEKEAILAALGPLGPPPAAGPDIDWVGPTINYERGRAGHSIALIVIHYTASGSAASTVAWFKNPKALVSAHYILDRDGQLYQVVRNQDIAWHAGLAARAGLSPEKNALRRARNSRLLANPRGIGIEIVNWGPLTRVGDHFETWSKRRFMGEIVERQGGYWEAYTDAQYASLIRLVGWLCRGHNVPAQYPPKGPGTYEPSEVPASLRTP